MLAGIAAGDAGAPLVLCLHGITANGYVFVPMLERLAADGFHAAALDQRGHGASAKPKEGYDAGAYAQDALAAIEALGHERAVLVGHSLGARNALTAAVRAPLRVLAWISTQPNSPNGEALFDRFYALVRRV